jgi:hypothetical protein
MKVAAVVMTCGLLLVGDAVRSADDWLDRPGVRPAMAQVAAAYAWAGICDRMVDPLAARKFIEAKLGPSHRYDAEQIATMLQMLVGTQSAFLSMMPLDTPAARARTCARAEEAFGQKGDQIPSLLRPGGGR